MSVKDTPYKIDEKFNGKNGNEVLNARMVSVCVCDAIVVLLFLHEKKVSFCL